MLIGPKHFIANIYHVRRQFVEVFVQEPVLREQCLRVIDAQQNLTETVVDSGLTLAQAVAGTFVTKE